jgi:spore coat polysaccharide biosynthesis protein SpsF
MTAPSANEAGGKRKIVAVIQARMGSTRFPGKVLQPVAGKPLLWHAVHRLKASRRVDEIAIATSVNPADDAIVRFAAAEGVTLIRGPEHDVLARFARAAQLLDADIIVRVSSDAPFIEAAFVDHLIDALIEQDGDYVLMEEGAACAHEGVDPFTRRALDKLMMDAAQDPAAREHVSGYFKLHPDFVKIARAPAYPALARAAGRLTIDTPDDLAFIEAAHARLGVQAGSASLADLLALLEREPQLRLLNAHVRQKAIAPQNGLTGGRALIWCNGGGAFGYGHVKRMVMLARALRDRQGMGVAFALCGSEDALVPIRRAGFAAQCAADPIALARDSKPDMLILDCREGPSRAALEKARADIALIAVIDDGHERRLAADIGFYPPVPQARALDWSGSRTLVRMGWDHTLLGLDPRAAQGHARDRMPARAPASRPTLLVAMGGSDPLGLTLRAAKALTRLDPVYRARFVIGAGMKDAARTARSIVALKDNFETVEGAGDLSSEYACADLALCAFGVTAYELACFGVPALYLGLTPDHALSASAFDAAGAGRSLGLASALSDAGLAGAVWDLMNDAARRRAMHKAGRAMIDGQGAERIAEALAEALKQQRAPLKAAL